jgi:probable rRNA maturation factor
MSSVELSAEGVEPPSWLPDIERITGAVCARAGKNGYDVSILLCSEDRIRELNREYRDIDEPTDVLTFSQSEGDDFPGQGVVDVSGDVAIAPTIVVKNAQEYGVNASREFLRVLVHALLHLCGLTHDGVKMGETGSEDIPMLLLQEDLVRELAKESVS